MVAQKSRLGNIELLRFVAMFLVLCLHANLLVFGPVEAAELPNALSRLFFIQLTIIAVNVFILISGWFSIKPSAKGFLNLLFQVAFYFLGTIAIMVGLGKAQLSLDLIKSMLIMGSGYWFVTSYIVLYILSPLLNTFIEHSNKRQLSIFLIIFYVVQTYYGWLLRDYEHFAYGYSALSFIGLYMLARFIRLYSSHIKIFKFSASTDFLIVLMIALCSTLISALQKKIGFDGMSQIQYNNPLVIIQATYLLLAFSKMKLNSKFANLLGASSFAIYLIHSHPLIFPHFRDLIRSFDNGIADWLLVLKIIGVLIIIAIVCILIDQFRILLWKSILKIGPLNRAITSFDEKSCYS